MHNLVVFVEPTAFNMWQDVKGPSDLLEASLVKLAKYQEPTNVGLQRMVKATKNDITIMVARLDDLIVKPKADFVPKLSDINILQEDLRKIMSNIDHCLAKGSEWNLATFGCTREQLVEWRSLVHATKADLDHKDSERRKAADSRVDANSKGKKADWPQQITADSWSTYLQIWNKEKENFLSDWHRCKHLCSAMTNEDKMTFGLFTDPDKIIYGLMQIYGSEADIVPAKIKEMPNLKPPSRMIILIYRRTCISSSYVFSILKSRGRAPGLRPMWSTRL